MADAHKNFAYSTVAGTTSANNADAGTTGTAITVASGNGTLFPAVPFNATIWPAGAQPTSTNAEIVRVTAISTDTFTITRMQEGSNVRNILHTDQIAATITSKVVVDAESPLASFSPFIVASGTATGAQTLASTFNLSSSNSLYIFPITVPANIQFNQLILANSLSYSTSAAAENASNSHYLYFGLYSMNASTALSLIGSNSFSIGETVNSVSLTWVFPTTTATSGYGYGTLNMSATSMISSYINGSRAVGLQFGSDMHLTRNIYYLGLLSLGSSGAGAHNTYGLSNWSLIGQIIPPHNQMPGTNTVSGIMPIGSAHSSFTVNRANSTNWWGMHMIGFLTNTARAGFGGTQIPSAVTLSEIAAAGAATTQTILPTVSFLSI